ncbi:MAG: hypothetical protein J0M22_13035 [Gammaproteobacteria bacterium]|nr:hypothetical protein [Gammaproteobacteria bacterium]
MKKLAQVILLIFPLSAHAYGLGEVISPLAKGFLGLVLMVIIITLVLEAIKKPKVAILIVVFFTLSITVGFGIPLLTMNYTDNFFAHLLSPIIGLIACLKIISLGERFYGEKNDNNG